MKEIHMELYDNLDKVILEQVCDELDYAFNSKLYSYTWSKLHQQLYSELHIELHDQLTDELQSI
jgi:hypothetical protein